MLVNNKLSRSSGAYAAPESTLLLGCAEDAILASSVDLELGAGDDLGLGQEFDF